jgi:hypothetical protein
MRWTLLVVSLVVATGVVALPAPANATGGEGEAWPSFTESSGCGAQRISTVHAAEQGNLDNEALLRGDFAAMFGRSVGQVRGDLVSWRVPGSTKVLAVHPRLLPALDQATAHIERSFSEGNSYHIDSPTTFSAAARTISGTLRVSRHTYGAAFDVNTRQNPFSKANELRTDLPDWWIQSFLDAGFCWGGLWIGSKDAMHFSWQGPAFSAEGRLPAPYAPLTAPVPFVNPAVSIRIVPQPDSSVVATVLADANNNGAIDVIRVARDGSDLVIDASLASRRHNECSSRISIVPGLGTTAVRSVGIGFGDLDGRGGQDLWIATDDGGMLRITVRWAFGGYVAETSAITQIPTPPQSAWISTGDFDVNGMIDVYIATDDMLEVWAVDPDRGTTSLLLETANPVPGADQYFLGDLDLDNRPDLWAIESGDVFVSYAKDQYRSVDEQYRPLGLPRDLHDVRAADYDGDGRVDLITFDGISKQVWLGNTRLSDGLPLETWFEFDDRVCAEGEPTSDRQEFRFTTSTWIASGAYEWRSRNGLPVGCDPSDDGCDAETVTREMFAEFLAGRTNAAAWALEAAGYAIPCASLDSQCWQEPMPRAELAGSLGQFLTARRGDVPSPHRWVMSRISPGIYRLSPI